MRFVVLLFGFISITLTACAGVMFFFYFETLLHMIDVNQLLFLKFIETSPTGTSNGESGLFLLIAAGFGFLGTLLGFFRCGWQGALLLLIPILCTVIMNPYSAVFTAPQIFTALLAFFVFPLPLNAPKKNVDEEYDD